MKILWVETSAVDADSFVVVVVVVVDDDDDDADDDDVDDVENSDAASASEIAVIGLTLEAEDVLVVLLLPLEEKKEFCTFFAATSSTFSPLVFISSTTLSCGDFGFKGSTFAALTGELFLKLIEEDRKVGGTDVTDLLPTPPSSDAFSFLIGGDFFGGGGA